MSILGVDFGEKRIGLAISTGILAEPLGVILNNQKIFPNLEKICRQFQIEKIVVGLPEGKLTKKVLDFGAKCYQKLKIKVDFESEVLTTKKATKLLIEAGNRQKKRRKQIDAVTAAVILQDYLDRQS